EVLDSGRFVKGGVLRKFEGEFRDFCSAKYAIGLSSGTAAILLSLIAVGIGKGDEVIVPSHTFIATATPILFLGAKPIFVDIDLETYTIDPIDVGDKITDRTKAIIPVHLYGHPSDMDPIIDLAQDNGFHVIEDSCQAHGALYKNEKVGTIGDIGCFSFYPSKNMTVCGDGGMVVTNDEELADKIYMLRDHGRREEDKHLHRILGLNFRLSEIHSAIGRQQLKHLPEWIEKRRKVADLYTKLLEDVGQITTPIEKGWARHVYHLYVIRTPQRDGLREHLEKSGVGTGIHYPLPVHRQPCMGDSRYLALPNTEKCAREVLSLPIHPQLTEGQVEYVVNTIKAWRR
ncbi:MAG: DegT/DnrJ/EryC1/StrS family aminotransferase, partial [Methanocellales archaeon]|nr:DegT/DnrJ/EryC1/StrS family aminotransferase [Methanocellales archaeon]